MSQVWQAGEISRSAAQVGIGAGLAVASAPLCMAMSSGLNLLGGLGLLLGAWTALKGFLRASNAVNGIEPIGAERIAAWRAAHAGPSMSSGRAPGI